MSTPTPPLPPAVPPPPTSSADAASPALKFYSINAVLIATFLGAPVAGCIILAVNYLRCGQKRQAWVSILCGVLATALLMYLGGLIPDSVHIPALSLALPPVLLMAALANSLQGARLREHVVAGGKQASTWAAAGIGLACGVVIVALLFGVLFAFSGPSGTRFAVGSSEIYYTGAATEADARTLADALKAAGGLQEDHPITLQLSKDAEGFAVCFVISEAALADPTSLDGFRAVGNILADSPLGHPLTIWLCDDAMTKKKRVTIK